MLGSVRVRVLGSGEKTGPKQWNLEEGVRRIVRTAYGTGRRIVLGGMKREQEDYVQGCVRQTEVGIDVIRRVLSKGGKLGGQEGPCLDNTGTSPRPSSL